MADNVVANAGSGGATFATDEDVANSRHVPYCKIMYGADGTFTIVSTSNGFPVQFVSGSTVALAAGSSVIGHVIVDSGTITLPSGAASSANQVTELASLASIDGKLPSLGQALAAASVPIVLTSAQLTTLTPPAAITGFSTESTLSTLNGKVTACNTGAVTISAALPAGTNGIGKLTTNTGVTIGSVEIAAAQTLATVTTVGTVTTVTTCSTVTTVSALTGSGVAHDGVDSGNPHKIGARATASLSGLTLVSAADRTDLLAGVDGALINRPHTNLEDIVSGNATNTDGTATACIAAQSAGIKTYLTTIILANSHASTNCTVDIKDGSTVKLSIPVPANGGAVINLPVPLPGTAATAWNFDPSAAVTTITCSMIGFKSKV